MRTSEVGINLIIKWEGFSSEPYICPAGVVTIGYGSIWDINGDPVTMDHPQVTKDEARALVQRELHHVEGSMTRLISVPLNQNQYDALASFIYNVGTGNFQSSTLRMKLNRGDHFAASQEFWKWRRGGGRILKGLVKRRKAEEELFLREV